jgi:hypothetical protein
LYASLDNLWFSTNSLLDLVDTFFKQGGTHLFLDEVHGYPQWAQAIKNIYDDYPQLNVEPEIISYQPRFNGLGKRSHTAAQRSQRPGKMPHTETRRHKDHKGDQI